MLTHTIIKGEPSSLLLAAIERRRNGGYGPAEGRFPDPPPAVRCEVWPGGDLPVVAAPDCSWHDADAGVVAIDFTATLTAALSVGWYKGRVVVDDGSGESVTWFTLTVLPGPGSGELRPAYHTYADILSECPDVESCIDEDHDRGGFAQVAARSRDWIDAAIADRASERLRPAYAAAIADGHMILDTPAGRMLAEASMYRTISMILRRAKWDGADARREDYERWADEALAAATASFAESTGLAPLSPHAFRVGRLVR